MYGDLIQDGAHVVQGPGTAMLGWWVFGHGIANVKFLTYQYIRNDLTWHPLSVMSCLELTF